MIRKSLSFILSHLIIVHQVENLAAAGVTDIVLAVNYRPEIMVAALKKVELALHTKTNNISMRNGIMFVLRSPSKQNLLVQLAPWHWPKRYSQKTILRSLFSIPMSFVYVIAKLCLTDFCRTILSIN